MLWCKISSLFVSKLGVGSDEGAGSFCLPESAGHSVCEARPRASGHTSIYSSSHCLGFAFNLAGFIVAANQKIHEDLDRVKCFDAEGALKYGIIDRIVLPSQIKKEEYAGQKKHQWDMRLD
ncbi:hypothetical protein BRADI_4g15781v3 [Brachypodium distachyon]|uniref:ATP-dependent Clp protease proteolytic subunit n=1 Tax=Brachypodium distachyon TaxID=15368 RepID=A0A0Q3HID3_BRADI|nr:hypothetical protein BRADI_4g15781v3 [Brachypodium distachyon]